MDGARRRLSDMGCDIRSVGTSMSLLRGEKVTSQLLF